MCERMERLRAVEDCGKCEEEKRNSGESAQVMQARLGEEE